MKQIYLFDFLFLLSYAESQLFRIRPAPVLVSILLVQQTKKALCLYQYLKKRREKNSIFDVGLRKIRETAQYGKAYIYRERS